MNGDTQSVTPLSDEELARSHLYRLLGVLLAAPPDRRVVQLLESVSQQAGNDSPLAPVWSDLRAKAETLQLEQLEEEYFKLFIGLGRGELLPYASWYVDGALMERILASLRQDLRHLGIKRCDKVKEPEDHVAAICETMGMIISDSPLSFKQSDFFERYIGNWMDRFFADLESAETADFYRVVGRLGGYFIGIEKEYFSLPA